ncbi:MAG: transporter substrate-binding domain-containing protein [Collinsella sp.]
MEIDLCYQIAAAVFDVTYDEARERELVAFTDVTPKTRGPLIDNDQLDVVCATYTITPERIESWDFSTPYRTDYVGLMVKKRSGFTRIADLDGRIIGVSQGATTQGLIEQMLKDEGIDARPEFLAFSGYPIIKSSLDAGNIDCFAMDRSTLAGYMNETVELLEPECEVRRAELWRCHQEGQRPVHGRGRVRARLRGERLARCRDREVGVGVNARRTARSPALGADICQYGAVLGGLRRDPQGRRRGPGPGLAAGYVAGVFSTTRCAYLARHLPRVRRVLSRTRRCRCRCCSCTWPARSSCRS